MEVYDALNLDDRSDWRAWNTNVETFLGIHYETQVSSFTLVEDVYKRLKITENNLPRMMLLKRVQAALGNTVDLFGQDYFVNMKSKQYPEISSQELSKHSMKNSELESRRNLALNNPNAAQVNMNVTYEEACALSYFREGEIMKGLKEISGTSYMPVIVNEVRAMIASEAIMYATDPSTMLRKQSHELTKFVDLNLLHGEMVEKMPSFVKILDFIKHAVPTGKRQKDTYSQEKREAIIASILAKCLCSFDSKLDAYKVQLSSLLLNSGTSGEFELDLLAETNDTYPYKQKKRFAQRSTSGSGPKSDIVLYKGKDGKSKMVNLYDLVKYDPADGSAGEGEEEAGTGTNLSISLDSESEQKPFLVVTKAPSRARRRRRNVRSWRPYRVTSSTVDMSAVGGGDGALTADNVAAVNVGEESDNALTSMCIDEVVESDNALMAENLTAVDAAEVVLAEQMMQPCDTTVHAGLSRFSDVPDTGDGLEVITEETV